MPLLSIDNRVKESSTTTGTGTLSLDGALEGFQTFLGASGIASGETVPYAVFHVDADEWEVGYGTITSGTPDTLSRDTILASSNAGSAVNFSAGTKHVFLDIPAEQVLLADSPLDLDEVATPSNPSAGRNKLYFKSDGNLYKLDDGGTEEAVGGGGAWELLSTATPSGVASADFTLPTGHAAFLFVLEHVIPATDAVDLWVRLSNDGGSTFESGSSAYEWRSRTSRFSDGVDAESGSNGAAQMNVNGTDSNAPIGSAAGEEGFSGIVEVVGANASDETTLQWRGVFLNNFGAKMLVPSGSGRRDAAEANDALQFLFSSGNIESGTIKLYGVTS